LVATDIPGCREAVLNNITGLLVPPRNPQALAAALKTLIDNPALRVKMGAAARQRAVAEFSDSIICEKTLLVYESLIPGSPQ
jgi:glycosyltransferase involved in cell wall biosynthesis